MALTAHINTARKRKRDAAGKEMIAEAKRLASTREVAGYAIIAFTDAGEAEVVFDTGGLMPLWAFPGACEYVVRAKGVEQVDEDYVRPLGRTPWANEGQ